MELLEATGGSLVRGRKSARLGGISTDTRTIKPGQTFIALSGERFDGHDYIRAAISKGAGAVVVSRIPDMKRLPESLVVIKVKDTLKALGDIAAHKRALSGAKVVAVTGSNGKTTTKEMIAQALSGKYNVLRNPGNLNNLVGLPLSILGLTTSHDAAVFEMGTNLPGEIARLTEIARPDVGLITNAGPVHLQGLKSIQGVVNAKSELISGLSERSSFILNLDDKMLRLRAKKFKGKLFGFSAKPQGGLESGESVHVTRVSGEVYKGRPGIMVEVRRKVDSRQKGKPIKFRIPGINVQNAVNAAAAICAARALGVPFEEAGSRLSGFRILSGRGNIFRTKSGVVVIDESYNANPVSMQMALENLVFWKKGRTGIAVLGEMMELGSETGKRHRMLGELAAGLGVEILIFRGEHAKEVVRGAKKQGMSDRSIIICRSNADILKRLKSMARKGDWILVKGSRKMRMEEVVQRLVKAGTRII